MTFYYRATATTQIAFDLMYSKMARDVLDSGLTDVGEWQAQKGVNGETLEITHARVDVPIPRDPEHWAWQVGANLPWAEDHFQERIGGEPLNPPPSEVYWPYAVKGNVDHKVEGKEFSHTYPERFWPRYANGGEYYVENDGVGGAIRGIRYSYGDYHSLIDVLAENLHTRQAYLPIWFPEDLVASIMGERVPCTLGYHFLVRKGKMDVEYHIRSCDMVRHFRDDVYMAGRLVHNLIEQLAVDVVPGDLVMNIGSLHAFPPDRYGLEKFLSGSAARFSKHLMEQL